MVSALSLAWFERRMARSGRPLPTLRWVAAGVAMAALVLGWLGARR